MRMLAYGVVADAIDEYLRISESTTKKYTERFVRAVINIFGEKYMRRPNVADIEHLLHMSQQRGFPSMLGSIDCMHWE
jgi:Plant transposon protein